MSAETPHGGRKRPRDGDSKSTDETTKTVNRPGIGKIGGKQRKNSASFHAQKHSQKTDSQIRHDRRRIRKSGDHSGKYHATSQTQVDQSRPNEILSSRKRRPLLVEKRQDWFNFDSPVATNTSSRPLPEKIFANLLDYGMQLLKEENQNYAAAQTKSSSHNFHSTIMSSGTLSDKVSALTLSVQESPLHNMHALETLVALAKKRSRSQAVQVLGALKDLFSAGTILPSDRRLRTFAAQPSLLLLSPADIQSWNASVPLPSSLTKTYLTILAFEDWLKATYLQIIRLIEVWCNDEIIFSRLKAIDYVFELLREKPEQEANLLRLLVNKLGDREKKVASRASYNLIQLQVPHPSMKHVVVSTIESDVLFKPGQNISAKYYAVVTLNQTVLEGNQQGLVSKILDIYFTLFLSLSDENERSTARPGNQNHNHLTGQNSAPTTGRDRGNKSIASSKSSEMTTEFKDKYLSAILTGINRAVPFAGSNDEFFEKHLDTLFAITHAANFNASLQALLLVEQICGVHSAALDRFYRTVYESLLDQRLFSTPKQDLFINLLYRVLCADLNTKRVYAFVKRVIQVTALYEPAFACKMIYLTKKLGDFFPSLLTLLDQPEAMYSEGDSDHEDSTAPYGLSKPQRLTLRSQPSLSYDGKKRDPQFSNADLSCLWESDPLLYHYHPSVSLFASKLHQPREEIMTEPDQSSHSLISFLDRFVYRNPKKRAGGLRGASLMQPLAATTSNLRLLVNPQARRNQTHRSMDAVKRIPEIEREPNTHEAFFHQYFNVKDKGKKSNSGKTPKIANPSSASDIDVDDQDGLKEDEIWKSLVDSRPELDANDDSVFDFESDLSSLDSTTDESDDDIELYASESGASDDRAQTGDDDVELVADAQSSSKLNGGRMITARKRRKNLKGLPVFASAGDYEEMLKDNGENG